MMMDYSHTEHYIHQTQSQLMGIRNFSSTKLWTSEAEEEECNTLCAGEVRVLKVMSGSQQAS